MNAFAEYPIYLSVGDPILAKVQVKNSFGWSEKSDPNTSGATLKTKPQ